MLKNIFIFSFFVALVAFYFNKNEILNSISQSTTNSNSNTVKVFTKEELKKFDGTQSSKLYLSILGQVFDVTKGKAYKKGGGYNFFCGKDGTRAFVSGDFTEKGLIESIEGLDPIQVLDIKEWNDFYHKDYTFIGVLEGEYYDSEGNPTSQYHKMVSLVEKGRQLKKEQEDIKKKYPPCNSKWASGQGGELWCSTESGGIKRDWEGYPRQRYDKTFKNSSCVCVKAFDDPDPSLKLYKDCDPKSKVCKIPPT